MNQQPIPYDEFLDVYSAMLPDLEISHEELIRAVEAEHVIAGIEECLNVMNIRQLFQNRFQKKIKTLCIIPCSNFVANVIGSFEKAFDKVFVCDNYKKGQVVGSVEVIDQEALRPFRDEIDAYFVVTRDPKLQRFFLESIPNDRTLLVDVLMKKPDLRAFRYTDNVKRRVEDLLSRIRAAHRPVLFLDGYYFNNFTPILHSLEARGFEVFSVCRNRGVYFAGHAAHHDMIPLKNKWILNFPEMIYLLQNLDKGVLLTNTISFLCHNFDTVKAIASLAYQLAITRIARVPHYLFLYDVVDTIDEKLEFEDSYLRVYRKLLASVSGVILSSNPEQVAVFLKRTLAIETPMLSFFRYNHYVPNLKPKLEHGFHIAMVGQFMYYTRDIRDTIKTLLRSGVFLHYYSKCERSLAFEAGLPDALKPFFRHHDSIVEQERLIFEISQYHAGWIADSTDRWAKMIAAVKSPFLRDLFVMFRMNTLASSFLCQALAGLPIFLNRICLPGLLARYPKEFFIPIELSEAVAIREIIEETDWEARYQVIMEARKQLSIEDNIDTLIHFIQPGTTA